MKITYEMSEKEIKEACLDWLEQNAEGFFISDAKSEELIQQHTDAYGLKFIFKCEVEND